MKLKFTILFLLLMMGSVYAQKPKPVTPTPAPAVKLPFRIEIGDTEYPQEVVLAVGTTTAFHCAEEALNIVIGAAGVDSGQSNPQLGRADVYMRATNGGIRTNAIFEMKSGAFIVQIRTVEVNGGAKAGDYHGEVWIKGKGGTNPGNGVAAENTLLKSQLSSLQAQLTQQRADAEKFRLEIERLNAIPKSNGNSSLLVAENAKLRNQLDDQKKEIDRLTAALASAGSAGTSSEKSLRVQLAAQKTEIEKLNAALKAKTSVNPNSGLQLATENASLKSEITRKDAEIKRLAAALSIADRNASAKCPPCKQPSAVPDISAKIAEAVNDSIEVTLQSLEEISAQVKPKAKRKFEIGNAKLSTLNAPVTDKMGRTWVGFYLLSQDTNPVRVESVKDLNSGSTVIVPKQFRNGTNRSLRYNEETWFWVCVVPDKSGYIPARLEVHLENGPAVNILLQ